MFMIGLFVVWHALGSNHACRGSWGGCAEWGSLLFVLTLIFILVSF